MFASTGTNGSPEGGAAVEEGRKSPVKSDESDGTTAAQSRMEGTVTTSDYFDAGQFGTYVSIFMLLIGMVGSVLGLNYAPGITLSQWTSDCKPGFFDACKSSGAILRISMALSIIFFLQIVGTSFFTKFYDYLWLIKFVVFLGLLILFYFLQAEIFDLNGYAWYARVAAFFYLMVQQVILLDFAYTWNDKWVKHSEEAGEGGCGNLWLIFLLAVSVTLIVFSCAVIGIMFWQFGKCADSLVILSLTIILCTLSCVQQIFFSDEGSIMTSAIIFSYATYICYSAVTLNPNSTCNPTISTGYQTVSQAIGMGITIVSLIWAGTTTIGKIKETHVETSDGEDKKSYKSKVLKRILQEISLVFLLISSYYAMVLTNWATIQSNFNLSSAKQGTAAMWIQAAGQWIAIILYMWSLAAPKIFPDRDFGGRQND